MEQNEEKKMVKVDFTKIALKDIEGNEQFIDIRKPLGNQLYMQGEDIVECELGRKIWNSDGEIEIDQQEVNAVVKFTQQYPYLTRSAVKRACGIEA